MPFLVNLYVAAYEIPTGYEIWLYGFLSNPFTNPEQVPQTFLRKRTRGNWKVTNLFAVHLWVIPR